MNRSKKGGGVPGSRGLLGSFDPRVPCSAALPAYKAESARSRVRRRLPAEEAGQRLSTWGSKYPRVEILGPKHYTWHGCWELVP